MIIKAADEATQEQIDTYGIIGFYSTYGKYETHIVLNGDADIHEVGEALNAFLLATGFSPSTIAEILDIPK